MPGLVVTEYARDPVAPTVSVAVTVKVNVEALDGVPVNAPLAELSDSPPGNAPAVIEKVTAPVPPVALSACEYAIPTVPFGSVTGFTTSAAATTTVYAREPVAPSVSLPVIVKLNVPAALGTPVIAPLASVQRQTGRQRTRGDSEGDSTGAAGRADALRIGDALCRRRQRRRIDSDRRVDNDGVRATARCAKAVGCCDCEIEAAGGG